MNNNIDWKKYLIVLLITASLFLSATYLSNYFSEKKINELKSIQENVAINILSSETQYSLLQESSCKNVSGSLLSEELGELGQKLEWSQKNLGDTQQVSYLKKYYSLLEIKDYLLMKKISHFYTTANTCNNCDKEGMVLSSLHDKYPELRVYSFDYSIDLSAVKAMLQIYKIKDTKLPALVLSDELLTGFHGVDELDALLKEAFKLQQKK